MAETLRKGTRVTGTERDKLATDLKKRYDSGESIRALAHATGRSYGFIHRLLTETGVALRGGAAPPGRQWRSQPVNGHDTMVRHWLIQFGNEAAPQ